MELPEPGGDGFEAGDAWVLEEEGEDDGGVDAVDEGAVGVEVGEERREG